MELTIWNIELDVERLEQSLGGLTEQDRQDILCLSRKLHELANRLEKISDPV